MQIHRYHLARLYAHFGQRVGGNLPVRVSNVEQPRGPQPLA